tara:strand:- start:474 stop:578 length:105 start_codon:yes stop_codon:yes gene_type:complete
MTVEVAQIIADAILDLASGVLFGSGIIALAIVLK